MTWTTHGHWFGPVKPTAEDLQARPDATARCGGPGMCPVCSAEAAGRMTPQTPKPNRENMRFKQSSMTASMFELGRLFGAEDNRYQAKHRNADKPAASMDVDTDEVGVWDRQITGWVMDPTMDQEKADLYARIINLEFFLQQLGERMAKNHEQTLRMANTVKGWAQQMERIEKWAESQGFPADGDKPDGMRLKPGSSRKDW